MNHRDTRTTIHILRFDFRLAFLITVNLIAFCIPAVATEPTTSIDLLIVAGQSNATGFDTDPAKLEADELDAVIRFRFRVGDPPPDQHDSISSRTNWEVLSVQPLGKPGPKSEPRQYGNFANPSGGFGPEISFARKLKRRDQQLGRAQVKSQKEKEIVFGPQAEMEGEKGDRGWSGGIYGQSCGGFFYPLWLKEHNEARAALKPTDWNRLTIMAKGDIVKTWVNGVPAAYWVDNGTYAKGAFGLQIHKGKEGTVLWRDLRVKELKP